MKMYNDVISKRRSSFDFPLPLFNSFFSDFCLYYFGISLEPLHWNDSQARTIWSPPPPVVVCGQIDNYFFFISAVNLRFFFLPSKMAELILNSKSSKTSIPPTELTHSDCRQRKKNDAESFAIFIFKFIYRRLYPTKPKSCFAYCEAQSDLFIYALSGH